MKINFLRKKYTGLHLIIAIIIGFYFKELSLFKPLLNLILMLILYFSFLKLKLSAKKMLKKELAYFFVIVWLILPILSLFFLKFIDPEFRIGFFIIMITPPALGSPVIVQITEGDLELTISNVVIYNLLSPLAFSILPFFFLDISGLEIPILKIFLKISLIIFLPLILALTTRNFKNLSDKITTFSLKYNRFFLYILILIASASAGTKMSTIQFSKLLQLFTKVFILSLGLYLVGSLISTNFKMKRTLPVNIGHKNSVLAILIGFLNFNENAIIPALFYLISHHILNSLLIFLTTITRRKV